MHGSPGVDPQYPISHVLWPNLGVQHWEGSGAQGHPQFPKTQVSLGGTCTTNKHINKALAQSSSLCPDAHRMAWPGEDQEWKNSSSPIWCLMNDSKTTELSNYPGSGWLAKNQNLNRGNMIERIQNYWWYKWICLSYLLVWVARERLQEINHVKGKQHVLRNLGSVYNLGSRQTSQQNIGSRDLKFGSLDERAANHPHVRGLWTEPPPNVGQKESH